MADGDCIAGSTLRIASQAGTFNTSARQPQATAQWLRLALQLAELAFISGALWLALALVFDAPGDVALSTALPILLVAPLNWLVLRHCGAHHLAFSTRPTRHVTRLALNLTVMNAAAGILIFAFTNPEIARSAGLAKLLLIIALSALHGSAAFIGSALRTRWQFAETAIIVGATDRARSVIEEAARDRSLKIVGVFDDRIDRSPAALKHVPVLGRVDDLLSWPSLADVDVIILAISSDARRRIQAIAQQLNALPQRVILLLDTDGLPLAFDRALDGSTTLSGAPTDARRVVTKRLLDLALASAILVVLSPIMAAIALLVKQDSPGPILFRQRRHGFNNEIIRVWKFRTMRHDPDAELRIQSQTTDDDPRITRIGRWLRRTSLDELPQLFNVLSGEMSVVGPRPHALGMTTEGDDVEALVRDYAHRHRMKPGITGWAQINGSRGPVPTREALEARIAYDLDYIRRSSIWFDLEIVLKTVPCLLEDRDRTR